SAGALIAVLNAVTIPCGFLAAWAADHVGTRRLWLGGAAMLQLLGLLGVVLLPGAGWLWAVVLGFAIGPLFPLTLTLPLDAAAGLWVRVGAAAVLGLVDSSLSPTRLAAGRSSARRPQPAASS